ERLRGARSLPSRRSCRSSRGPGDPSPARGARSGPGEVHELQALPRLPQRGERESGRPDHRRGAGLRRSRIGARRPVRGVARHGGAGAGSDAREHRPDEAGPEHRRRPAWRRIRRLGGRCPEL
ncbi:MAG: hypothetical protein AVDCRST_MAG30-4668, partial [uncultured Solirubrobacteraceae bacterium]